MIKKLGLLTLVCLIGWYNLPANAGEPLPEGKYGANNNTNSKAVVRPRLKMPQSIVVCRAKQCAPARLSTSKEYIFNTLLHMFDSNARQKALVCQGNATTHACVEEFIRVPITVGITPADLYIDDVKIADVSISQRNTMALNLLLNWDVSYNGQTPVCRPSKNLLYVKNVNNVIMEDNGYTCKMTTVGNTIISTMFAIDYIDLDYGYIGGYYSIGLSGPAFGGGSGYMIIRLPNDITIDAKDFEVKPLDPKIEESVEETIEEIPLDVPQNAAPANNQPPAQPVSQKVEEAPKTEPVHLTAPILPNGYPTQGQYLYDSNSGQYIPLKALNGNAQQPAVAAQPTVPVAAPQVQPVAAPMDPVMYAATSRKVYGNISDTMPTDAELTADLQTQAPMQTPIPMLTPVQYNQPVVPQSQVPMYGQYFYDPSSGTYVPTYPQYGLPTAQVPAQTANREPQAPNVSTIIKYNHPAQEYEKAKAEAAAEAERQRTAEAKKKEIEAQAVDFGGVKVFPLPSSNEDRTAVAPTLKNSLSEYNHRESRRFE